jgi:hypothetical protein
LGDYHAVLDAVLAGPTGGAEGVRNSCIWIRLRGATKTGVSKQNSKSGMLIEKAYLISVDVCIDHLRFPLPTPMLGDPLLCYPVATRIGHCTLAYIMGTKFAHSVCQREVLTVKDCS